LAKLPATGKLQFAEFPSRSTPKVAAYKGPCSIFSPKIVFSSESELAVSSALLVSQFPYSEQAWNKTGAQASQFLQSTGSTRDIPTEFQKRAIPHVENTSSFRSITALKIRFLTYKNQST
jgi:hypothetical protein